MDSLGPTRAVSVCSAGPEALLVGQLLLCGCRPPWMGSHGENPGLPSHVASGRGHDLSGPSALLAT